MQQVKLKSWKQLIDTLKAVEKGKDVELVFDHRDYYTNRPKTFKLSSSGEHKGIPIVVAVTERDGRFVLWYRGMTLAHVGRMTADALLSGDKVCFIYLLTSSNRLLGWTTINL